MTPSDNDLDSLLKTWTVPASPDSLDTRMRQAYRNRPRSAPWRLSLPPRLAPAAGLFTGIAAGAVVFLLVLAQAFPRSIAALADGASAFTVDSEELEYQPDGSSKILEYFTSDANGHPLSSEFPGNPLRTMQQKIMDPLNVMLLRMAKPLIDRRQAALDERFPRRAKFIAELQRTCGPANAETAVVGNQTILNHPATGHQTTWMEDGKPVRHTTWLALDLPCFPLRSTTEKTLGDGSFHLKWERRALRITMTPTASAKN